MLTPFRSDDRRTQSFNGRHWPRRDPHADQDELSIRDSAETPLRVSSGTHDMLERVSFQDLLIAKIERCLDLLEVGHPGVGEQLTSAISMIETESGEPSVAR